MPAYTSVNQFALRRWQVAALVLVSAWALATALVSVYSGWAEMARAEQAESASSDYAQALQTYTFQYMLWQLDVKRGEVGPEPDMPRQPPVRAVAAGWKGLWRAVQGNPEPFIIALLLGVGGSGLAWEIGVKPGHPRKPSTVRILHYLVMGYVGLASFIAVSMLIEIGRVLMR